MDFVSRLDESVRGLTTSQVAALIAFGTFASQLLLSFIWPLILVGYISESESAVTWSVAGRVLHNSFWPAVLQTDATATAGVRRRVSVVSYGVILGSILVAVAGIVTPLGLYDSISPSDKETPVRFEYVPDKTALGLGTAPRHDTLGFSRRCSDSNGTEVIAVASCPHSDVEVTLIGVNENGTTTIDASAGYDTRIPKNVYEFFQSGVPRLGQTVSSLFDIEYRNYRLTRDSAGAYFQNGSDYLVGDYRQIANMALNDELEVVEGLVVDTKNGSVGFRNHTAPAEQFEFGAHWREDILFIEPVTECASLNITLEYSIPKQTGTSGVVKNKVGNLSLVDRGGFVDFDPAIPRYDENGDQEDPNLALRAYIGARASNMNLMYFFNVSKPDAIREGRVVLPYLDSEHGKRIPLPAMNREGENDYSVEKISIDNGLFAWDFLDAAFALSSNSSVGSSVPSNSSDLGADDEIIHKPKNPWGISSENFTDIDLECAGSTGGDIANIKSVRGQCGPARGMPQRSDGSDSVRLEQGSEWALPLYYCASASRALVKTVSFSVDNTTSLAGIKVTSIAEKEYRDASEYPIWAVENTGRNMSTVKPLWGLVDSEDESPLEDISFKAHPHLWLAGYEFFPDDEGKGDAFQNIAGLQFHSMALGVAYSVGRFDDITYSGAGSLPMYNRWMELTRSPEGMAKVISLIWTDVSANAVVGTRGQMPRGEPPGLAPAYKGRSEDGKKKKRAESADQGGEDAFANVRVVEHKVRYRIPYAIPAFITLALLLGTLGFALAALVTRHATPRRIRWFLTRLSAGRIMAATLVRGSTDVSGPAGTGGDKWVEGPGRVTVDISGQSPTVEGELVRVDDSEVSEKTRATPGTGVSPSSSMLEGHDRGAT